jgi:hypothetical protein
MRLTRLPSRWRGIWGEIMHTDLHTGENRLVETGVCARWRPLGQGELIGGQLLVLFFVFGYVSLLPCVQSSGSKRKGFLPPIVSNTIESPLGHNLSDRNCRAIN